MRLFFDTEFTELTCHARLLSIGIVDEVGRAFYAEFKPQYGAVVDDWVAQHVIAPMRWLSLPTEHQPYWCQEQGCLVGFDSEAQVAKQLSQWLSVYDEVELWADCPAYDWVLLCQLFGGSLHLPKPLNYVVNDFATVLTWQGKDALAPRASLLSSAEMPTGQQHNALYDAQLLRACFSKLLQTRSVTFTE